jgi:hypothetical protein
MTAISAMLIAMLVALALLHAFWGLGGRWPGHNERSLVALVVGRTHLMRMPGIVASMLVAAALLASIQDKLLSVDFGAPGEKIMHAGFWLACAVFALRGVAGFIPPIFAYADDTPFARLDRLVYSPLCLFIALGLAATGTGIS